MISAATSRTETSTDRGTAPIERLSHSSTFRDYQQTFENLTGLPLALRAPRSFQRSPHGARPLSSFWSLMASRTSSFAICLEMQQRLEEGITRERTTVEGFAGLFDAAVPLWVGEELVGYLQTGPVFLQPPTRRGFSKAMRQAGVKPGDRDRPELERAYFDTRLLTEAQYESVLRLLGAFARHLSTLVRRRPDSLAPTALPNAPELIAEHREEPMHLREKARAVSMSGFRFYKLFRRATGCTLTQYLARLRAEAARRVRSKPIVRVTESAFARGFRSPSPVSRMLLHVAGTTPAPVREKLHSLIRWQSPLPSPA